MQTKEKIRYLIEQRKMEATKKQVAQKLIQIARVLGHPIVSTHTTANRMPEWWQMERDAYLGDDGDIVKLEEDDQWVEYDQGYCYDGLKCGVNLHVICFAHDSKVFQVKATYNGYLVFLESEAEIKAYAPFPAWEDAMNMFHEAAVARDRTRAAKEKAEREIERQARFKKFWQAFRGLWGY